MSLADYLAKNYLNADPVDKRKKRKRKPVAEATVTIADDDALGWDNNKKDDNSDDDGPLVVGGKSADFRSKKASGWKRLGADSGAAEADAIVAASEVKPEDEDERPMVVGDIQDDRPLMSSGAKAGLQTGQEVAAAIAKKRKEEMDRFMKMDPKETGMGVETIYRDASGRVVNVAMARAEARRKLEEEERKKRDQEEKMKGEVQILERQERRQQLDDAKYMSLNRYADDKELNEELKEKERWADPAAAFLTKKKEGKSKTGKPLYAGASIPNRYGIPAGHKWDGVDRSNGFEKKWFKAQNEKKDRANLSYQWQFDE